MKYHSEYISLRRCERSAFSLIEAVAAVTVLAIIVSTVLVVFSRCSASAANSTLKMQAFEVARENMEALLTAEALSEQTEYGYSEKYPAILWTNRVETFFEPFGQKMWLRAVCSAEYEDPAGELKQVELTHWLTKLSDKQIEQILNAQKLLETKAAELGLSGPEELLPDKPQPGERTDDTLPTLPKNLSEMTPEEIRNLFGATPLEIRKWLDETSK